MDTDLIVQLAGYPKGLLLRDRRHGSLFLRSLGVARDTSDLQVSAERQAFWVTDQARDELPT